MGGLKNLIEATRLSSLDYRIDSPERRGSNTVIERSALQRGVSKPLAEQRIVTEAIHRFKSHLHFRGRSDWIQIAVENGTLRLNGLLPTFHLKQLAQEAVRGIEGIVEIRNDIVVANSESECELPPGRSPTTAADVRRPLSRFMNRRTGGQI